MKKLLLSLIILLSLQVKSYSQESGLGVGIMIGEPSGLSFKKWINSSNAIDAGLGWSFSEDGSIHFHADYLYHNFDLIKISDAKVPFYFGVGGRFKFKNEKKSVGNSIGVRIPVGVSYQFATAPFDVFLEVVPILDLSPDTRVSFNSALGVRYYFK
ncbi:MAG: DUF3996 domain-containing protein [Ignavibacteriae bacterium]|nr:DUF3996 domain-containing protein [Ignavibacteriota bacterium]